LSNTNTAPQKAIVLWLSGAKLTDLASLPAVEALRERGALVELEPSPITGPQAQHYQALSGRLPAYFGFFDTLVPRDYSVIEESAGRGTTPKLLPDLLRTVGWTVQYEETELSNLVASVQAWTQSAADAPACLVIKCSMRDSLLDADTSAIVQAMQLAQSWVGESGLLTLFSDTRPATVKRFVNVNNFLADMGVIERDEQGGQINWLNSLAYYAGYGQLWVNMLGRDAQGAVHPQDEYEEVRDSLIKAIPNKLRDHETGESVIERIYRKEELYSGDYLFCAPDLVVVFKPGYAPSPRSVRVEFDSATLITPAEGTKALAGVHPSSLKGFLVAAAPALQVGASASEVVSLTAVVPTILHVLGVEYVGLESPAVNALFSPSYLETHPIRSNTHNQELSEEEEELIIGHLRDLGYV
jgi:hypothetical protein